MSAATLFSCFGSSAALVSAWMVPRKFPASGSFQRPVNDNLRCLVVCGVLFSNAAHQGLHLCNRAYNLWHGKASVSFRGVNVAMACLCTRRNDRSCHDR